MDTESGQHKRALEVAGQVAAAYARSDTAKDPSAIWKLFVDQYTAIRELDRKPRSPKQAES